ncbi:MAG: Uma2 family endonuclease [Caldilineaceae bacterium]
MDTMSEVVTPAEYLAFERQTERKHEYFAGRIRAMPPVTARHSLIVVNLIAELGGQLRNRPELVFPSNMRLKVVKRGLYTYPDVTVVTDDSQYEDAVTDTLLNPLILIEVLSAETEAYDRGKKFHHYQTIESLTEYLLVAQDFYCVEQYVRQADGQWLFLEANRLSDTVHLPTINCDLQLAEVYHKVEPLPQLARLKGAQER